MKSIHWKGRNWFPEYGEPDKDTSAVLVPTDNNTWHKVAPDVFGMMLREARQ
jgi:hypothetical protein